MTNFSGGDSPSFLFFKIFHSRLQLLQLFEHFLMVDSSDIVLRIVEVGSLSPHECLS